MKGPRYYESDSDDDFSAKEDRVAERSTLLNSRRIKTAPKKPCRFLYATLSVLAIVIVLVCCSLWRTPSSSANLRASSFSDDRYLLAIVSDRDKQSRVEEEAKGMWQSVMKKAFLKRETDGSFSIEWAADVVLYTKVSEAGRGMELSALTSFNNHLYAFDDRTGLVFEVMNNRAVPRFILMEGDGNTDKGQKTEWATVKDGKMYVGSFGKEYTNPDGTIKNTNNMWVSVIDRNGVITHEDWTARFNKVREAAGCPYPGYMIHEAISWSPARRQWVILPRRVSKEAYDENEDERRGSNTVLLASEDFGKIEVRHITPLTPTRGFSDFKFLPGSKDNVIVALKSEENEEEQTQNSYITVFDLDGRVLMEETEVPGGMKFEGLEFLSTVCDKHDTARGCGGATPSSLRGSSPALPHRTPTQSTPSSHTCNTYRPSGTWSSPPRWLQRMQSCTLPTPQRPSATPLSTWAQTAETRAASTATQSRRALGRCSSPRRPGRTPPRRCLDDAERSTACRR